MHCALGYIKRQYFHKWAKRGIGISTYECRDNTLSSCFSLWHLKRPTGAVESDCVVIFHLGILLQSCNCLISLLIRRLAFTDRVACSVVMRVIQIKWEVMGAWFHNFAVHKRGHKSLKDLWNCCVFYIWRCSSFLKASLYQKWCWRRQMNVGARWRQPVTRRQDTSWFESRLYGPLLLGDIGGNDRADGARDIINPIMNSLWFGLDTLFLFISWYFLLVCMHFIFITVAHMKADRGIMTICRMMITFLYVK